MKKLLAASSALALVAAAAPAMAAEVGINVKTRTYNESGTRVVSYTGNTVENDFGLEAGVQWLADEMMREHALPIEVLVPEEPIEMDDRVRVLMYRCRSAPQASVLCETWVCALWYVC